MVIALLIWAVLVEPGRVVAREIRVPIARWPDGLGPLRIAAIADVHAGAPHMTLDALGGIVATMNAARPDLIVLLGDYVIHGIIGGRFIEPEPVAMVLGRLRAPLGVFAVTGNHDWWYDGPRVTAALEAAGIRVLDDAAALLPASGPLWIAGVGDLWTRPADVRRALAAVLAEAPVVVITHNPDLFPGVPARGAAHARRPHPRRSGGPAAPGPAHRALALRRALCDRPRAGGRTRPLRDPRPRHEHPAGALPRAARDLAADGRTMTR